MTDNWAEHWHSYPMFQPSHTRNFGFEIRIGWRINSHLRYQWHVPWCVNWVVRNFICWLGFVYHWFRLFTFLIKTKQITSKLKVHLKWPDYPSRPFFLKVCSKVMQSTPEYQQHFSEILLQWISALRSNTFTRSSGTSVHGETLWNMWPDFVFWHILPVSITCLQAARRL